MPFITHPELKKEAKIHSLVHRTLHWAIALVMLFILLTILLRLGWLNKFHVAGILDENLQAQGIHLGEDELITLAKKVRKPMWDWHIWSGYVLLGLYAMRLLLMAKSGAAFILPWSKHAVSRERFQSATYIAFYIFIFASLLTGMLIVHGPKAWKGWLESIHEWGLWYLVIFIFLHFAGLYLSEKDGKGKVREMIYGSEES